jgi:hypothetical protein
MQLLRIGQNLVQQHGQKSARQQAGGQQNLEGNVILLQRELVSIQHFV